MNGITGFRAYKNLIVNILETGLYFNLLAFAAFSLYDFRIDITKQTAVAYTSTIITFILLKGGRSGMASMAFAIPLFWFVYARPYHFTGMHSSHTPPPGLPSGLGHHEL